MPSARRKLATLRNVILKERHLRILLVQDSAETHDLLQEIQHAGLSTNARTVDSEQAFRAALDEFAPDVVIADHQTNGFDCLAALEALRSVRPATPLIVLTNRLDDELATRCFHNGAEAIVLADNISRLPGAITAALEVRRGLTRLSPRQIEVLRFVAEGQSTREIAERLGLSVKTVESHRGALMRRLEARSLADLVRYAMRTGLVGPEPLQSVA